MANKPRILDATGAVIEPTGGEEAAQSMLTDAGNMAIKQIEYSPAAAHAAVAGLHKTQADVKAKMEKAMKTAEEFVTFSQGNMEAFVKAGQIWAAGMQDITKQVAATAQAQMDHTVATFKALATVKSVKEALELHTGLARTSMEKVVAETGKITDASMKLAEQAIAPLTARVTLAVETFGRAA